jgi:uncharacterized protein YndB with AHSA1/START domain
MADTADTTDRLRAEIAANPADGTLTKVGGRWVLTLTRKLRHPVERVWPKLTEPEQLRTWSPVVPDRPLTSVGPAVSHETPDGPGADAEVLVSDPPRELVHRWGPHLLRWTLAPAPAGGSVLTLEHTLDVRDDAAMNAAGWHLCLAALAANLDGHDVGRIVGIRARDCGWSALKDRYDAALSS